MLPAGPPGMFTANAVDAVNPPRHAPAANAVDALGMPPNSLPMVPENQLWHELPGFPCAKRVRLPTRDGYGPQASESSLADEVSESSSEPNDHETLRLPAE